VTSARFVATHSVLTLNAAHPYVAKSLADAHEMHRTVMSGFRGWVPDGEPDARSQTGVLSTWTVDLKNARLVLVVQSRVPADWSHIPGAALADKPHTLTVDRTLRTGDTVGFRTVVNPVHTRPRRDPDTGRALERGRRLAHTRPEHVKGWFTRRLQALGEPRNAPDGLPRIGATADPSTLGIRMLPTVTSASTRKGLRVVRAEIRGSLTVTDPPALAQVLTQGLGHARAYSCGLLLTR
jgi:CRISPR system Cascade subunit CasE